MALANLVKGLVKAQVTGLSEILNEVGGVGTGGF